MSKLATNKNTFIIEVVMTEDEVKVANMYEELEKLKNSCLLIHSDSITYKLCEILQEFILYTASKEQ